MNGVHDMGGMHGFGPVDIERDEPVFHHRWEGVVRAMMQRTNGRYYNFDEFRHAVERMPSDEYLRAAYYERWLHAVATLLLEKGVITTDELTDGHAVMPAPPATCHSEPRRAPEPRFQASARPSTRHTH